MGYTGHQSSGLGLLENRDTKHIQKQFHCGGNDGSERSHVCVVGSNPEWDLGVDDIFSGRIAFPGPTNPKAAFRSGLLDKLGFAFTKLRAQTQEMAGRLRQSRAALDAASFAQTAAL